MRKKLLRFADNSQVANLLQPDKPNYDKMAGKWHVHFSKEAPISLELGCGHGTYTTTLAKCFPQALFIGIDIKGSRLWTGSQYALTHNLTNVAFLRTKIEHLDRFFAPGEVTEIYLTFPDPQSRSRDAKRRLTSTRFLNLYQKILQPTGTIHLKTDNQPLVDYTLDTLSQHQGKVLTYYTDLYRQSPANSMHQQIQTPYEKRFLAMRQQIKYLHFTLTASSVPPTNI